MNCELMLTYDTPALRQTGSRNLMGPKTLPTIWGTYMKLVTKYKISAINSCWEKCDEKWAYMFSVYKNQQSRQTGSRNLITGARGTDLLPPFFLTFCLQIYFQLNFFISLLFHLFFLILTCSCQYSYNLMPTSNCMCRPYINTNNTQGMQLGRFKNRTPCSLRVHVLHLISNMSFKLGHVSIPKRRIFLSLFLFCAYNSSVLQNFKIFTHLLPNFSYKDPRLMEVTYHCINFNDRVRNVPNI